MNAQWEKYSSINAEFASFGGSVSPNEGYSWNNTYSFVISTEFGKFVVQGGRMIDSKCDECGGGSRWGAEQLTCGGCGKVQGTRSTGINGFLKSIDRGNMYALIAERTGMSAYEAIIVGNSFWSATDQLAALWVELDGLPAESNANAPVYRFDN